MSRRMPIFYSALMLTGVNLLLRFVSTSFQVYISGKIGPAGVGLLQLVMSVGGLAMTAGMAGIRTATMYLTAEEIGKKKPGNVTWVLSGCFGYSILCSGIVGTILYIFAPFLATAWIGDLRTVTAIRLFSGFLPVSCLCGVMTGYFTAANRISTLAAVEVAEQFCSMAITLLTLLFWAGSDPARACQAIIFGSGISSCATLLILVLIRQRQRSPHGRRIPVAGRLVRSALPLGVSDVVRSGISTTENLMVPRRLALYPGVDDPLATFGTICGMVFPVLMFPAAILFGLAELLIPELARCDAAGSEPRIRYLVKRSIRVTTVYGCFFGGLMFLLAKPLCLALYDNRHAGEYLQLFAVLIPMLYCDAITDAMTKGLGQQVACVRYNIFTSGLDILFLFFLLPRYGMVGYFISFAVTHLLNFILSFRRLSKISHCRVPVQMPLLTLAGTAAAVFLAATLPSAGLQAVAFIAIFLCLLFLCGVLRKEDIRWIAGLIKRK